MFHFLNFFFPLKFYHVNILTPLEAGGLFIRDVSII
jgi:hypothetical protein